MKLECMRREPEVTGNLLARQRYDKYVGLIECDGSKHLSQEELFSAIGVRKGAKPVIDPMVERLMGVEELLGGHDTGEFASLYIIKQSMLTTRWYCFYRRVDESGEAVPFGDRIVHAEPQVFDEHTESIIWSDQRLPWGPPPRKERMYVLEIPSVLLPSGINLRDACGIGYVDSAQLEYDAGVVTFKKELIRNPENIHLAEMIAPISRGNENISIARVLFELECDFSLRRSYYGAATGWHGSVLLHINPELDFCVSAAHPWTFFLKDESFATIIIGEPGANQGKNR